MFCDDCCDYKSSDRWAKALKCFCCSECGRTMVTITIGSLSGILADIIFSNFTSSWWLQAIFSSGIAALSAAVFDFASQLIGYKCCSPENSGQQHSAPGFHVKKLVGYELICVLLGFGSGISVDAFIEKHEDLGIFLPSSVASILRTVPAKIGSKALARAAFCIPSICSSIFSRCCSKNSAQEMNNIVEISTPPESNDSEVPLIQGYIPT